MSLVDHIFTNLMSLPAGFHCLATHPGVIIPVITQTQTLDTVF
jgi:hypothetical protein